MPIAPNPRDAPGPSVAGQLRRYLVRHRTLFWTLHSIWALVAGGLVVFLAHERYGFAPWVILFLVLTWASTLVFSRTMVDDAGPPDSAGSATSRSEVASYLTRIMYQEILFFTLPFYWYSTVVGSPNVVFSVLLVGLAVLSCIDLLFDRFFRAHYLFGLVYFATVTFAATNLIVPILLPLDPMFATPLAACIAIGSAIPLVPKAALGRRSEIAWLGVLAASFLVVAVGLQRFVPPVPLRLQSVTFTSDIDPVTFVPADELSSIINSERLGGSMFVLVEVFAPANLPTLVNVEWKRNGEVFRTSREIEIVAHEQGFRIWDGFREKARSIAPGTYEVVLRTAGDRVFGKAEVDVTGE